MITAAREDVDAYVGQTPIFDGARTIAHFVRQMGPIYGLRTTIAGLRDLGRKYTGREPYYIPIWGEYPDELPALAPPGSREGHEALVGAAASDEEVNRCAARAFLTLGLYRPITNARRLSCPALVIEGANDTIAPKSAIAATVARLPDVRYITIEADHFGAFGESFEEVVAQEGTFLKRHLLGEAQ